MLLLLLLVALAAVVITGLLWRSMIFFNIKARSTYCELTVDIRFFYRLISMPLRLRLEFNAGDGLVITRFTRRGYVKQARVKDATTPRKEIFHSAITERIFNIDNIKIAMTVGVKDNAFLCVMLAGASRIILDNAACFLLTSDERARTFIYVRPDFTKHIFALDMEGALCLYPHQIMRAAAIQIRQKSKKAKALVSREAEAAM